MQPSKEQMDILTELINIGAGKGAEVLNTMLNAHIELSVPELRFVSQSEFFDELSQVEDYSGILMGFEGHFSGKSRLFFPLETATKLVSAILPDDQDENSADFDMIKSGTLSEIGNIVLNGMMGSISNNLNIHFDYTVPVYIEGKIQDIVQLNTVSDEEILLMARARFDIKELELDGNIAMFFEMDTMKALLESIDTLDGHLA